MKALVIVAPTVDGETRDALRVALHYHLVAPAHSCELYEVRPHEDIAAAVARLVDDRFDCVVAVGGDGTVSAVAHALVDKPVPLGIVPAGTGNLVARELGIPLDIEAAVGLLTGPRHTRRIDAMRISGRTFLLNAGVGINAEVIDQTSRLGTSLFGRSAYVGTAVWKVLQAKPQRMVVSLDGAEATYHATDIAISNCGILAKALNPNGPDVRVDDGRIDVCILCMKTPLEYPWYYFLKRIAPQRVNRIMHELSATRRVTVSSDVPLVVQADGDIVGTTPVSVDVLPNALAVIVP